LDLLQLWLNGEIRPHFVLCLEVLDHGYLKEA